MELLGKLQEAIGRGDVCEPYSVASGAAPDLELTLEAKATGQVIKFRMWRVEIEQWRDIDPLTRTPVAGPSHLKIVGDVESTEQLPVPEENKPQ